MKPFMERFKHQGLVPLGGSDQENRQRPVIGVGRMDPENRRVVLTEGKVDLVAFGRALFADPDLPNKLVAGRDRRSPHAPRCGTCGDPITAPGVARSRRPGKEGEYAFKPAEKEKGWSWWRRSSGMEAGEVAALRGHECRLYEKSSQMAGLLPLAAMVKGLNS